MAAQPLGSHAVPSWFPISSQSGVTPMPAQSVAHLLVDLRSVPAVPALLKVPLDQGSVIHCASLPS